MLGSQNWAQHSSCGLTGAKQENHFPGLAGFAVLLVQSSLQLSLSQLSLSTEGLMTHFVVSCHVCRATFRPLSSLHGTGLSKRRVSQLTLLSFMRLLAAHFSSLLRPCKVAALHSSLPTLLLSSMLSASLLGHEIFPVCPCYVIPEAPPKPDVWFGEEE